MIPHSVLEVVLDKLGIGVAPDPDLNGLTDLFDAWCHRIPFDNIRKVIAISEQSALPLPGAEPADFFDAWLRFGAGGTCWAQVGALHALLTTLGFDARRGVATMMIAPGIPPNHGTVVAKIDGVRYLVDPSMQHAAPLPLHPDRETTVVHGASPASARLVDGRWQIHWLPLRRPQGLDCRIDEPDVSGATCNARHEATRAWSPFNFELYLQLRRGDGVVGSTKGRRVERSASGAERETVLEGDARARFLVEEIGIAESLVALLPPDRPTPPPP